MSKPMGLAARHLISGKNQQVDRQVFKFHPTSGWVRYVSDQRFQCLFMIFIAGFIQVLTGYVRWRTLCSGVVEHCQGMVPRTTNMISNQRLSMC